MEFGAGLLLVLITMARRLASDTSAGDDDSGWAMIPGLVVIFWLFRLVFHFAGGSSGSGAGAVSLESARSLMEAGNYDAAEHQLKEVLRKTQKKAGKTSIEAAVVMNQLGARAGAKGRLARS